MDDDFDFYNTIIPSIFNTLLNHKSVNYFKYSTRFPTEYNNEHFKGVPSSLKFLSLPNYNGINTSLLNVTLIKENEE